MRAGSPLFQKQRSRQHFPAAPSVIVGRGSQFFLRNRKDVFHVFLYASRDHKIRRLISKGETQDKAIELVDTTDKARAAFVRQYLGLKWQEPHLYHAMFNTEMGESCTATMLVECVQQFERGEQSPWPEQRSQA